VAWRAVHAARALVKLSDEAVRVAEIKLANERQRYQNGRTTAQLLVLVQTDLIQERLAQQQARATLHKSLVDVWAASGSLLVKLGTKS
jgi:outer membrane protein TolC